MIPVSLYGIDANMCENFYSQFPNLVSDSIEDEDYAKTIYSIQEKASINHVFISEKWSERAPQTSQNHLQSRPEKYERCVLHHLVQNLYNWY